MGKLIMNPEFQLYERNGQAFCGSRQVAEEFQKEHRNVLRDINALNCSPEFTALNFEWSKYKDSSGKWNPEVLMKKDGFTFLVMGYRGKKAARFKEAYIARFNSMNQFIESLKSAKLEFPEFTEAINLAHDEPKSYYFSNELNMINKIVLGMNAKQFKALHNLNEVSSIRPYLTSEQITLIERLQKFDIGLIYTEPDFQRRKSILTDYSQRISTRLLKSSV